jgi:catechol 2,3-dioxygenase-like lactoylglutathione lyase family enzyme
VLHRLGVPGTIQIRLLVLDEKTPLVHSSYDAMEPGPFSLGFPTLDLPAWEPEIRERGFGSLNVREEYQVPRPDGSKYWIHETIFNGPDFVHAVGISRKDGMPQLGPVDAATGRGGPVYSAQSIERSDEVLAFYTDVLGLELRSDREWKSAGTKGALNVPDGTVFRFSIVYAPGATSGHLLFIDFRDAARPPTGVAPRPPHRGLVMWSFPVQSVPEIEERARSAGVPIVGGPFSYESPELGAHRAITLEAPDGFLVELFDGGEDRPFADIPLLRAP